MKKILLVEADRNMVYILTPFLQIESYEVDNVDGQRKAMYLVKRKDYSIILLNINLKEGNGFKLYQEIKDYKDIPILFFTSSQGEFSIISQLNLGADHYIHKPFRTRMLISIIDNILYKYQNKELIYELHNIKINATSCQVIKFDKKILLTDLEYNLLLLFFIYPNQLLARRFLIEEIRSMCGESLSENILNLYLKRIRYKIEDDPLNPIIIKTLEDDV